MITKLKIALEVFTFIFTEKWGTYGLPNLKKEKQRKQKQNKQTNNKALLLYDNIN